MEDRVGDTRPLEFAYLLKKKNQGLLISLLKVFLGADMSKIAQKLKIPKNVQFVFQADKLCRKIHPLK